MLNVKIINTKNFLFRLLAISLGIWVTFSNKIIFGKFLYSTPLLARPASYLRGIGIFLIFLLLILIIKPISLSKNTSSESIDIKTTKIVLLPLFILLLCVLTMEKIGFIISSTIVLTLVSFIY